MGYAALMAIAPLAIAHSVHAAVHWWEDVESLYPAITHSGQLLVVLGVVGIHQPLPFSFAVTLLSVGITSIVAGYVGWRAHG